MAIHPGRGEESGRKEVETSEVYQKSRATQQDSPTPACSQPPGTDRPGGLSCPAATSPLWPVASKLSTPQARRFPAASLASGGFLTVFQRFRRRRGAPGSTPQSGSGSTPFIRKKLSGNSVHTFKPTNPAYGKRKVSAGTWSPGKKRCRQEPNAPGGSSGGPDSRPGCLGGHIPRNVSNRPFWTERCGLCVA